ncbi:PGC-1 and ERR-induced regulator in muscle protein 1 isoform X1 [Pan troglodytes]|uniref:PGC-1 and ERR-induced regulator in muscle protein 1 isoform X1 n=1 Tax=Pan troglodytes TaxID=9598 RepID=UPI0023F1D07A|nr:PGC-1 and ERR-induced regulator in muscle protein 1 isoform X1 [Pan troglodytes]XP_009452957.3 PGC-1 and ERR-induced regulator in muscle protein 1 isoform X1 [Pan troglodytes]XP_016814058.3 PGC-1 and ERR-induced regulator in muscle protein 1 isoform X1 [Pan troglodytes]XP_024212244.2 PGC-1 and ERR-induced regulator in muscle protein 1 isoform X1 [Pan troglodytes]
MENFQYSVQLSDQDWAEFSATADECGLLQAGLASGDEPLSSDIDQGDSSGGSPPRAPPLPTGQPAAGGRSRRGCEEEDVATQQPVSRSQGEPVLALGTGQQTPSTSARAEAPPSLGPGASPPGQCSSCPGPASSGDQMQRLLQGPAPRPPGEPPGSPESPGHSTGSQRPPDSPGAPPRSPSRKKRRAVGAKGGGHTGASASAQTGSPLLPVASPETAKLMAKAGQEELGPGPAGAPEPGPRSPVQEDRPGPGLGLSAAVPVTEQGTDPIRTRRRAKLHTVSTAVREALPDVSRAKSDMAVSTPASEPQPDRDMAVSTPASEPQPDRDMAVSTPASEPQPDRDMAMSTPASEPQPDVAVSTPASEPQPDRDMAVSTPASEPQSDTAVSTPASEPQPDRDMAVSTPASEPQSDTAVSTPASEPQPDRDMAVSTPASEPQSDTAVSTPASEPQSSVALSTPISKPQLNTDMAVSTPASELQPDVAVSTPASKHGLDVALPTAGPAAKLEVASSPPVSEAVPRMTESSGLVSTPVPRADAAGPAWPPTRRAGPDVVETEAVVSEPSAGAPGCCSGAPALGLTQVPRKKKVRFSVAGPGPNKPGSGEASARPSAPRTATGGHGGPGAWEAVAVGPRPHQPRILKHLPRPPPSAVTRAGPGSSFAVTLPEAYEFFFCDTIEENEEAEAAAAGQDPAGVQWPDVCEFFFPDVGAQRSRRRGSPEPLPRADPVPAPIPEDPVPISIPEVYEHFFFGEDRLEGVLGPAVPLPLQALEPPGSASQGAGPGTPLKPAVVERLHLALRRAGELRGPVPSFAFSQNDMCLVFVAFATWAVRTSDLHTPDAWKTVLLANIGTISAIRYFRRQVGQGRRSRSPSPSPSS